jgi:hypothetical protein
MIHMEIRHEGSGLPQFAFGHVLGTLAPKQLKYHNILPALWEAFMDRKGFAIVIFATLQILAVSAAIPFQANGSTGEKQVPFVCPVTHPNGSQPPTSILKGPDLHGNGSLWVALARNGKLNLQQNEQGDWGAKVPWWREAHGELTITGRRLDAEAPPLRAQSGGYGDTGFVASAIFIPTEGCWEVSGRVGSSTLTFVVEAVHAK